MCSLYAILAGFVIDLLAGDPHGLPHPVVLIGKLIAVLEKRFRILFPRAGSSQRWAGALLWLIVVCVSTAVPALLLWGCQAISPWLRLAVESIMCWQILAVKSLRVESMKVYRALKRGSLKQARYAVSMIVGRDTDRLDEQGVARAAVETVAENTSDGVIAPLLFLAVGGAPLGFFYKAVNTMDSMLGYKDPPYTDIGMVPARADDVVNFIPARLAALLLLLSGALIRLLQLYRLPLIAIHDSVMPDPANGWRIFRRDRHKHASPNSAQTESVCAGLLRVRLAGDAWYRGVLHHKEFIGDPLREIEPEDIPRSCRYMTGAAVLALVLFCAIRALAVLG